MSGKKRLLWWWFSGLPMDGRPRTDASWLHRSQNILHYTHSVMWWHHQPRLLRAAIRNAVTWGFVLVLWGLLTHRTATLAVLGLLGVAAGFALGWRAWFLLRRWNHHRRYVRPLRRALTSELTVPPPKLAIEPDRSKVTVWVPDELTGSERERQAITLAVTAKLALEAPDADWCLTGKKPHVTFTKSEPPPANVMFAQIRAAIEAAAPHEIVMGIGKKDQVTVVSVDNDSPHAGLSMQSGDGKSTVAKNMAAQLLYHGCLLMVLDYKLISHMWARGLPNVAYAGTPMEIEAALVWLKDEVTRRNQVALAAADVEGNVHADVGPRIFVICEELNATQNRLKAWWNDDMGEKGRSPGSRALDEVMFLGRQVLVNVLQIGQRLSVKASGSGDARENLGVLVFADPTASAWKMLVGDRHVLPPASGHRGRLQIVTRKEVRETQGAFFTGQQARDFATSGTVALPPMGMPCVTSVPVLVAGQQMRYVASDQGIDVQQSMLPPARPPGTVTLREAVDAGMWPTIGAARMAKQRHKPKVMGTEGRDHLFLIEDLAACQSGKEK